MGLIFAPAMSTRPAASPDPTGRGLGDGEHLRQVGGSIGHRPAKTIFASTVTSYVVSHGGGAATAASASMEGYRTAFLWAAGIFALGSVVAALVFRTGAPALAPAAGS